MSQRRDSGTSERLSPLGGSHGFVNRRSPVQSGAPAQSSDKPESIEEWRPVPGLVGRYEVSSHGRARNVQSGKLVGYVTSDGYIGVGYTIERGARAGSHRTTLVHSWVAAAFIGPRPPSHEVDHVNRKRWDNRPENLQYLWEVKNRARGHRTGDPRRFRREALAELPSFRQVNCGFCHKPGHNQRRCRAMVARLGEAIGKAVSK